MKGSIVTRSAWMKNVGLVFTLLAGIAVVPSLPGVRLPAHIVVGAHGMPVDTYIRITLFAVTIYVPIIFACAYSFGPEIDAALVSVQRFGNAVWIILLVTIIVWSTIRFWIMRQSLAEQNQELL